MWPQSDIWPNRRADLDHISRRSETIAGTMKKIRILSCALALTSFAVVMAPAYAQTVDSEEFQRIEAVHVSIANPSADSRLNARIEDQVRRAIGVFPSTRFRPETIDFALARAKRDARIGDIDYSVEFGPTGGVVLDVSVTLKEPGTLAQPRGMLATGEAKNFPILYDSNGTFLKLKFESTALHYGNANAWYGRPDLMLAGNPLVVGKPSGKGYEHWAEGFVHGGLYGITPVTQNLYVYGGISTIASGSVGQELFTDETRGYVGVEDAYAGFVTGTTTSEGNRVVFNASAGRQRFLLGDGFLIANTSANGYDRAALQANPRWAADMLALAQFAYNDTKLEAFYLDPDELPVVDSHTAIQGINFETALTPSLDIGLSFLRVPKSTFGYYTPTETFSREGLQVYDGRFRWQPNEVGQSGPFVAGEFALQRNENFDMRAFGLYGEVGYSFAELPWTPTLSYRYAQFSGDDPSTGRFERWDPLLSGGNGEQWVQGINHFKIWQDSNVIAHRFQMRLRPTPKFELVPQVWLFRADSTTNLGGNPALSFLGSDDLGYEVNLTGKVFVSRQVYVQGHVAATFPGEAVKTALGHDQDPWWSTMLFIRTAF